MAASYHPAGYSSDEDDECGTWVSVSNDGYDFTASNYEDEYPTLGARRERQHPPKHIIKEAETSTPDKILSNLVWNKNTGARRRVDALKINSSASDVGCETFGRGNATKKSPKPNVTSSWGIVSSDARNRPTQVDAGCAGDGFTMYNNRPVCDGVKGANEGVEECDWVKEMLKSSSDTTALVGSKEVDEIWLTDVSEAWNRKQSSMFEVLEQCWATVVNPFTTMLHIAENPCPFIPSKKQPWVLSMLKAFKEFLSRDGMREKYSDCLDELIQLRAFYFGLKTGSVNSGRMELLTDCYRLDRLKDPTPVVSVINQLMEKKHYEKASSSIIALKLQQRFNLEEICYPLLFQGYITQIENYIASSTELQMSFLCLVDFLLDKTTDLDLVALDYDIPQVRKEQLRSKPLLKLAVRLIKLYELPEAKFPNVMFKRSHCALKYWFSRKYVQKNIGAKQWEELILACVGTDPRLHAELIELCIDQLELREATKWAVRLSVPVESVPHQITKLLREAYRVAEQNGGEDEDDVEELSPGVNDKYHRLALKQSEIHWIDSRVLFHVFLDHIDKMEGEIGLDAEWRPTFTQILGHRLSVLQLAVPDAAYLFDMLVLVELLEDEDWKQFAHQVFSSPRRVVLGYGIDEDLRMLMRSAPAIQKYMTGVRTIDLCTLHYTIRHCFSETPGSSSQSESEETNHLNATPNRGAKFKVVPLTNEEMILRGEPLSQGGGASAGSKRDERGLSDLVKHLLGRRLDKRQQLSDWERRPLRRAQVIYAALDAYCLLDAYTVIKDMIDRFDVPVDLARMSMGKSICSGLTKLEKQQQRAKRRVTEESVNVRPSAMSHWVPSVSPDHDQQVAANDSSISPPQLCVVCDIMLTGLGRKLRSCGVDVHLLEAGQPHEKTIEIALREQRIILTTGAAFDALRVHVAPGQCYRVKSNETGDQVNEVMHYFNVKVTVDDIFSRCQVCNNDEYLQIHPAEMRDAWLKRRRQLSLSISPPPSKSPVQVPELPDGTVNRYDHLDMTTLCTAGGVAIRVENIPEEKFDVVSVFYVCMNCGKVYWSGGHRKRTVEKFRLLVGNVGDPVDVA